MKLQQELLKNIFLSSRLKSWLNSDLLDYKHLYVPQRILILNLPENANIVVLVGIKLNEVHTSVFSQNRSEINQDCSCEDEKNISQQL